ncbi:MAG: SH3 domain-containing protein [Candidatus Wallbacteria bacterium]|nr:SH3 domain-containing protein [Candidatus Wallbacteria bacterium]
MLYQVCVFIILSELLLCPVVHAGYNAREVLEAVITASDVSAEDEALWRHYVEQPQPSVDEVRAMIAAAAKEFSVPSSILETVGYLESNWIQIGPTIDRGWGVMHLVENDRVDTLGEAAGLLNCERQVLKDDPQANIRGAAALLASFAGEKRAGFSRLEDWFDAVKKLSGLYEEEFQEMQSGQYFRILKKGVSEINLFNQEVRVCAQKSIDMELIESKMPKYKSWKAEAARSRADYPGAISDITSCNYTGGRNHNIDTWVNHWMGMGTYAGAISWFHNPSASASTQFCIRHDDGEITQVVRVADTSWNCGSPTGLANNSRSISVEHEATVAHPEWWNSQAMIQASGRMIRFFADQYGIPVQRGCPGITEHKAMQGCSTDCAGNIPWPDLWAVITGSNPGPVPNGNQTGHISVDTAANVRSGPGTEFPVIASLNNGVQVQILGKEDTWYKVIIPDGRTGYVHESLVAL